MLQPADHQPRIQTQLPQTRNRWLRVCEQLFYTAAVIGACILVGSPSSVSFAGPPQEPRQPTSPPRPAVGYELDFPALGTLVTLKAFHSDKSTVEAAFAAAQARVQALEMVLTDYNPASETRQLSERAVAQPQPVSDDLWQVLAASDRWHQLSGGGFDSSLGSLTSLWRKHRRVDRPPTAEAVQHALAHSGWQHVRLDPHTHSLQFLKDGIRLDFGAIGKGFIVDETFQVLQEHAVDCCLVNISGNMRAGAAPPGRDGWLIEIAPLQKGADALRRVSLAEKAIATSGDLWQFMVVDGQRRSHILDPRTGYGVLGPVAATVIAPTATDADAMATTACVLSFSESAQLAQRLGDFEILLAQPPAAATPDAPPRIQTTPGFPEP